MKVATIVGARPQFIKAAVVSRAFREHRPAVIEDAAQCFGATQHGRRSGGVTTIGSTSFFPPSRWGVMATAGRCSPTMTGWRKRCALFAPMAEFGGIITRCWE